MRRLRSLRLRRALAALVRSDGPAARRLRDDRGAVTATVAIMVGVGVLMGMAAVVVDVGRLYAEREQLQSGADAAAWAVAETCAVDPTSCGGQAPAGTAALRYAAANAADGAAGISVICGRGPGLSDCPAGAGNRTDCLGVAPEGVSFAEVRTRTEQSDGETLLPATFARALAGADTGTEVGACARVAWGPPQRSRGIAVTFSICEWNAMTDNGTTFWPAPSEGSPPAEAERVVYLKDNGAKTCDAGPSGWDRPGGFGWLDDPDGTCETTVSAGGDFDGFTGIAVSRPCRTALAETRETRRVLLLPIYDGVRGVGTGTTYHLAGFASFVLTGYTLPGAHARSWLTGARPCSGDQFCLYGYFTRGLLRTTGVPIGGPDLGTSVVNLIG